MPVRVRPQADQAPSLSRYGLSRSPGAALVKGLLNAGVTRGPVLLLDRPTEGDEAGTLVLLPRPQATRSIASDATKRILDAVYSLEANEQAGRQC